MVIYRHLWERDSLGKRPLFLLSGLTSKLFPKPVHLLWHQFQTFAITQHDRGDSRQSSHPSQGQEVHRPWKPPSHVLRASRSCQNSSAVCIKYQAKGFEKHLQGWKHGAISVPQKCMQVHPFDPFGARSHGEGWILPLAPKHYLKS